MKVFDIIVLKQCMYFSDHSLGNIAKLPDIFRYS